MKRTFSVLSAVALVLGTASSSWAPPSGGAGIGQSPIRLQADNVASPITTSIDIAVGGTNSSANIFLNSDGTAVFTGTVSAPAISPAPAAGPHTLLSGQSDMDTQYSLTSSTVYGLLYSTDTNYYLSSDITGSDNLGDHTATQALNMNSQVISAIGGTIRRTGNSLEFDFTTSDSRVYNWGLEVDDGVTYYTGQVSTYLEIPAAGTQFRFQFPSAGYALDVIEVSASKARLGVPSAGFTNIGTNSSYFGTGWFKALDVEGDILLAGDNAAICATAGKAGYIDTGTSTCVEFDTLAGSGTTYWTRSNNAVWPTNAGDSVGTATTAVGDVYADLLIADQQFTASSTVNMSAVCSTAGFALTYGSGGDIGCVELTGGAEVNNLEATITGIESGEIIYGTGADAAAYTAHNFAKIAGSVTDAQVPDDVTIVTTALSGTVSSTQIAADMARDSELHADESAASSIVAGVVELATAAEVNAGTDTTRAVTPQGIENWTGSTNLAFEADQLTATGVTSGYVLAADGANGTAFTAAGSSYTAGTNLDLTGTSFSLAIDAEVDGGAQIFTNVSSIRAGTGYFGVIVSTADSHFVDLGNDEAISTTTLSSYNLALYGVTDAGADSYYEFYDGTNRHRVFTDQNLLWGTGLSKSGDTVTPAVADSTQQGQVELATRAETETGTAQDRAVTPDALENWTGSTNLSFEADQLAATSVTAGYVLAADGANGTAFTAQSGSGTTYWTRSNNAVWPTNSGDSLGTANTTVGVAYLATTTMASAVVMSGEAGTDGWYVRLASDGNVYLGDPSGGTVNSFVTWDVTNGTDPAAETSTDTITIQDSQTVQFSGDSTADAISAQMIYKDSHFGVGASGLQLDTPVDEGLLDTTWTSGTIATLNGTTTIDTLQLSNVLGSNYIAADMARDSELTGFLTSPVDESDLDTQWTSGTIGTLNGTTVIDTLNLTNVLGSNYIAADMARDSELTGFLTSPVDESDLDTQWTSGTIGTLNGTTVIDTLNLTNVLGSNYIAADMARDSELTGFLTSPVDEADLDTQWTSGTIGTLNGTTVIDTLNLTNVLGSNYIASDMTRDSEVVGSYLSSPMVTTQLDALCGTDDKILKRQSGTWDCADDATGSGTSYWTRSNNAVWPTNAGDSIGTATTSAGSAWFTTTTSTEYKTDASDGSRYMLAANSTASSKTADGAWFADLADNEGKLYDGSTWKADYTESGTTKVKQGDGGTGIDSSAVTDGQLFIGGTASNNFALGTISGTANEIEITNGTNTIQVGIVTSPTLDGTNFSGVPDGALPATITANAFTGTTVTAVTTLDIPSGTGPDANAEGEIAVDNSVQGQIVFHDGTSQKTIMDFEIMSANFPSVVSGDHLSWHMPYAATLIEIDCAVDSGTSAILVLQECSTTNGSCADMDTRWTCDANGYQDASFTDSAIAADAYMRAVAGTVSGSVDNAHLTFRYRWSPQ